MSCCWGFFCFAFCFLFFLELKTTERWFFQRVHLYIWAIAWHKLGTLSIRVHSAMTVHDHSWALKFDNFSEFQNVIGAAPLSPSHSLRHYDALRMKIDMWCTLSACEVSWQTFLLLQAKNILAARQDYFCNVSYFYEAQSSLNLVVTSKINRHFRLLVRLSFYRINIYEDYLFNQNWVKEISGKICPKQNHRAISK